MKRLFLLYCLVCLSIHLQCQTCIFGQGFGKSSDDKIVEIDKTSDGVVMTTSTDVNFGLNGLYRIDKQGGGLWGFKFNEYYYNYSFLSSVVGRNDTIYSLILLDNNIPYSTTIDGVQFHAGINLAIIDPNGKVIKTKKIETISKNVKLLYSNNNLYVIGQFMGTMSIEDKYTFRNRYVYSSDSPTYDYFIAKFDSNGNILKAITLGEVYDDFMYDATIDENENIYFTGISSSNINNVRMYSHITKLNSALDLVWKKVIEKGYTSMYPDKLKPSNIHYSKNGKIYVWVTNSQLVVTDDFTLTCPCSSSTYYTPLSSHLLEYDSNTGNYLRKCQFANCVSTNNNLTAKGFMTEFDNDILIHTSFRQPINLSGSIVSPSINIDLDDYCQTLLLVRVNLKDFTPSLVTTIDGGKVVHNRGDNAGPLVLDADNNLYLTGEFMERPIYVLGKSVMNSNSSYTDVLFCKLNLNPLLVKTNNASVEVNRLTFYPNPVINQLYFNNKEQFDEIIIHDLLGNQIMSSKIISNSFNLSSLPSGMYLLSAYKNKELVKYSQIVKK
jgi:hypothetical protein